MRLAEFSRRTAANPAHCSGDTSELGGRSERSAARGCAGSRRSAVLTSTCCPASDRPGCRQCRGNRWSALQHARRAELLDACHDEEQRPSPGPTELAEIRSLISDLIWHGPATQRMAQARDLVAGAQVDSREAIFPVLNCPHWWDRGGLEPPTSALLRPERRACKSGGPEPRGRVLWGVTRS